MPAISFALDWLPMAVACGVSVVATALMVLVGVKVGSDKAEGVQKFHTQPTSRLGGVGIALGLLAGVWLGSTTQPKDALLGFWLLLLPPSQLP
jgi:UDP-N-acetylmuramyl pentapeptide phosphotransferase/UDP-N-acetylglucosamine-1-phosphate transferase